MPAGEWETYALTLIGRMVTVVANGTRVICNQEIPGITGGALDSNEGAPGPMSRAPAGWGKGEPRRRRAAALEAGPRRRPLEFS